MLIGVDLDDTLYKERDYVASGRRAVADDVCRSTTVDAATALGVMEMGDDAFDALAAFLAARGEVGWTVGRMVETYRNHTPRLAPDAELNALLDELRGQGHRVVVITDGHSDRQRAKVRALGIEAVVDGVYVSEEVGGDKCTGKGFEAAMSDFPQSRRIYIGDNPAKDFRYAALHGWETVMVAAQPGENVHPQSGGFPARTTVFDLKDFLRTLLRSRR